MEQRHRRDLYDFDDPMSDSDYDDLDESTFSLSAREIVEETLDEPLLSEMIFCRPRL